MRRAIVSAVLGLVSLGLIPVMAHADWLSPTQLETAMYADLYCGPMYPPYVGFPYFAPASAYFPSYPSPYYTPYGAYERYRDYWRHYTPFEGRDWELHPRHR